MVSIVEIYLLAYYKIDLKIVLVNLLDKSNR